jgi:fluoroacetyl-CoA thioesterase
MTVDQHLVGREGIARTTVNAGNSADAYGNTGLHVFATPALVALVEQAAMEAIRDDLAEGEMSVGGVVRVSHLAATPRGGIVTARAAVRSVEGRRIWFDVVAHDATEQVGEGEHQRIVVDKARFLARVERKIPAEG